MTAWLWLVAAAEATSPDDRFGQIITGLVAITIPVLSILATKWASRFAARTDKVEEKADRNEERLDRIDPDDDLDPKEMVQAFADTVEDIRNEFTGKVERLEVELAECNQRHALADADSTRKDEQILGLNARLEVSERRYAELEQSQHEVLAGVEAIKAHIRGEIKE